jgi:CRISPR-associated protein Cmr1
MMKILQYDVRFTTPAFLGNAEQAGQWRTPPFKALLRQWWRVAYSGERGFQIDQLEMRREEGLLFGNAWLSHQEHGRSVNDHCRSLVRLRLEHWNSGHMLAWEAATKVRHPEVPVAVGSDLYLGYGPLVLPRGGKDPELKVKPAIGPGESMRLSIAVPDESVKLITDAVRLIDRYGAVGGRSRNGWGSLSFVPISDTPALEGSTPARTWLDAMNWDWPHALGTDDRGGLVWQTAAFDHWGGVLRELAAIKVGLRTQFTFSTGNNTSHPEFRHWLSYPVTKHAVAGWRNARLPNSLRFKVRPDDADPTKLRGVIFHVPCLPPQGFHPDRPVIVETWRRVHGLLDELTHPREGRRYETIQDADRREELKPQLDAINLDRGRA